MSGFCRDCKWWQATAKSTRFDWGSYMVCAKTSGDGARADAIEDGTPEESLASAYSPDMPAVPAVLVTAPDFGCVQFEAND